MRSMRRFYTLAIQRTLFGGASVIPNWGCIGTNGRSMMEAFDGPKAAAGAFSPLLTKKRRGYREPDANGRD
jgi:predicted DNA-binding WGR domain protein